MTYCRDVVLLVFAAALVGKATGYSKFVGAASFVHVGSITGRSVAPAVLVAEGAVACSMLLAAAGLTAGFLLASVMLTMFSAALYQMRRSRVDDGCGCFGTDDHSVGSVHFARNGFLTALALVGAIASGLIGVNPIATFTVSGLLCLGISALSTWALVLGPGLLPTVRQTETSAELI
jgi:hypothetical protein